MAASVFWMSMYLRLAAATGIKTRSCPWLLRIGVIRNQRPALPGPLLVRLHVHCKLLTKRLNK